MNPKARWFALVGICSQGLGSLGPLQVSWGLEKIWSRIECFWGGFVGCPVHHVGFQPFYSHRTVRWGSHRAWPLELGSRLGREALFASPDRSVKGAPTIQWEGGRFGASSPFGLYCPVHIGPSGEVITRPSGEAFARARACGQPAFRPHRTVQWDIIGPSNECCFCLVLSFCVLLFGRLIRGFRCLFEKRGLGSILGLKC